MVAFGSESQFISDVADLNELPVRSCVRVAALCDLGWVLASNIFQISAFISLDAIASRVAVLVASIMRNIILVGRNWNKVSIWLIGILLLVEVALKLLLRLILLMRLLPEGLRLQTVVLLLIKVVVTVGRC